MDICFGLATSTLDFEPSVTYSAQNRTYLFYTRPYNVYYVQTRLSDVAQHEILRANSYVTVDL
jgi:hypothetical protein